MPNRTRNLRSNLLLQEVTTCGSDVQPYPIPMAVKMEAHDDGNCIFGDANTFVTYMYRDVELCIVSSVTNATYAPNVERDVDL